MEFEDKIKQGLKGLNNKQLCQFAWLCGLHSLPFLSVKRNFAYWPTEKRQEYLYGIFHALDVRSRSGDSHQNFIVYRICKVRYW